MAKKKSADLFDEAPVAKATAKKLLCQTEEKRRKRLFRCRY